MTIWVKEYQPILTLHAVSLLIKEKNTVKPFLSLDPICIEDIIIVSKEDRSTSDVNFMSFIVICYEEYFENISNNIIQEFQYNYDYYYLKNALAHASSAQCDTIITGSSYARYGIDENMLSHEVNMSLPSQDLYYSLKGIYQVCAQNKNIRNIVLCCGYYYFHSDMSRTTNSYEIQRLPKVYKQIFDDIHNCPLLPPKCEILYQSEIFDIQNVLDIFTTAEYEKHYFHRDNPRKKSASIEWEDKTKEWIQLSDDEKYLAGQRRADQHNTSKKHTLSFVENSHLFNELSVYCQKNNINLLVVVTPVTKYYLNTLYSDFKDSFYQVLNESDGVIHLLDLIDNIFFEENDFNDTDHLSDIGASKMTQLILDTLQELNQN